MSTYVSHCIYKKCPKSPS